MHTFHSYARSRHCSRLWGVSGQQGSPGPCSWEPMCWWEREQTEKQPSRRCSRVSICWSSLLGLCGLPSVHALASYFRKSGPLPSLLIPPSWTHHPIDPFAPLPPLFSHLGGCDRFLLFEASTVTGQELAGSGSGLGLPVVCGLLTLWRKDFVIAEYVKSIRLGVCLFQ